MLKIHLFAYSEKIGINKGKQVFYKLIRKNLPKRGPGFEEYVRIKIT